MLLLEDEVVAVVVVVVVVVMMRVVVVVVVLKHIYRPGQSFVFIHQLGAQAFMTRQVNHSQAFLVKGRPDGKHG